MQAMLMSNTQQVRKDASLTMMEFIRLKKEPPKPKQKEPEKQVQQVENKQQPQPKKEQPSPPKPKKIQQPTPVKQQSLPADLPKLDLPAPMPSAPANAPVISAAPAQPSRAVAPEAKPATASTGKVVSGVVPLERVEPKYPQRAASRHVEGWVKVEFTISTDGEVTDAEVIAAEPADIFDEAALKAIRQWKFKGKIVDGVAVEQRAEQTFRFKLAE
jgi:protein TonB